MKTRSQIEVEKFYNLLERSGNIYLSDINRMDQAFNIVRDNFKTQSKNII